MKHATDTGTYILRSIPSELWRAVKMKAAERGETVRAAILRLLAGYAKR